MGEILNPSWGGFGKAPPLEISQFGEEGEGQLHSSDIQGILSVPVFSAGDKCKELLVPRE